MLRRPYEAAVHVDTVLGFVILAAIIPTEFLVDLVNWLLTFDKPVSVLDEGGRAGPALNAIHSRYLKIFPMSYTTLAGEIAGNYLAGMGHRSVAYISPFHDRAWSQNRLAGLRRALSSVSRGSGVSAFVADLSYQPYARMRGADHDRRKVASLLGELLALPAGGRQLSDYTIERVWALMSPAMDEELLRDGLDPLFEQALSHTNITAWVASSDNIALQAMAFLRRAGKSIPRDISVLGFDDILDSFTHRLSTYNFNCSAYVAAMLRHVFQPDLQGRVQQQKALEIEGIVIERASTRRIG